MLLQQLLCIYEWNKLNVYESSELCPYTSFTTGRLCSVFPHTYLIIPCPSNITKLCGEDKFNQLSVFLAIYEKTYKEYDLELVALHVPECKSHQIVNIRICQPPLIPL